MSKVVRIADHGTAASHPPAQVSPLKSCLARKAFSVISLHLNPRRPLATILIPLCAAAAAPIARLVSAKAGRLTQSSAAYAIFGPASDAPPSSSSSSSPPVPTAPSSLRHALASPFLSRERAAFALPPSLASCDADVVALAKGEEKVLTFEFGAAVLLGSAVKCFEELLECAHNPLTLPALADRRNNSDVFGPAIISISGTILAVSDPSCPLVAPVMLKSAGARLRTAPVSGSGAGGKGVITALVRNVDVLTLLQRLLKCRPVPPSRRAAITIASVPADTRKAIVEQVLRETLNLYCSRILTAWLSC